MLRCTTPLRATGSSLPPPCRPGSDRTAPPQVPISPRLLSPGTAHPLGPRPAPSESAPPIPTGPHWPPLPASVPSPWPGVALSTSELPSKTRILRQTDPAKGGRTVVSGPTEYLQWAPLPPFTAKVLACIRDADQACFLGKAVTPSSEPSIEKGACMCVPTCLPRCKPFQRIHRNRGWSDPRF